MAALTLCITWEHSHVHNMGAFTLCITCEHSHYTEHGSTHTTLTTDNIHAPVGFEPTISAGERPQTYALDRAASGTGFTIHTRCTIYAAGRIIQLGGPRFEDPCSKQSHVPGFYSATSSRKLRTKRSIKGQQTSRGPNEGTSALTINNSINLLPSAGQRYPLD
jgi:hypothetical protein